MCLSLACSGTFISKYVIKEQIIKVMVFMFLPINEKYIYFTVTQMKRKKIIFITTLTVLLCYYFRRVSHWLRLFHFMIICLNYLLLKCIAIKTLTFKIIAELCDF